MTPQQQFDTLFEISKRLIASYQERRYLPQWLFQWLHPHSRIAVKMNSKINKLWDSVPTQAEAAIKRINLIRLLEEQRYHLTFNIQSKRLREKVKDALVFCLSADIADLADYKKKNITELTQLIYKHAQLEQYKKYLLQQQSHFAQTAPRREPELTWMTKDSFINGKLVDYFGEREMLAWGLKHLAMELHKVLKKRKTEGFLTKESVRGYLDKLEILRTQIFDYSMDEDSLIINCRYLLEDILNAAGVLPMNNLSHKKNKTLINVCYWLDELFKQARAKVILE